MGKRLASRIETGMVLVNHPTWLATDVSSRISVSRNSYKKLICVVPIDAPALQPVDRLPWVNRRYHPSGAAWHDAPLYKIAQTVPLQQDETQHRTRAAAHQRRLFRHS
jgi:hypothetical protein